MTSQINSSKYYRKDTIIPTFSRVTIATTSQTQLVAGIAGTRILVLSMAIGSSGTHTATIQSDSTDIAEFVLPTNESLTMEATFGLFVTEDGEDLNITMSTATSVTTSFTYIRI